MVSGTYEKVEPAVFGAKEERLGNLTYLDVELSGRHGCRWSAARLELASREPMPIEDLLHSRWNHAIECTTILGVGADGN